jgi:hypothetical protein
MNARSFGYLSVILLLLALLSAGSAQSGQPSDKDAALVVLVTWDDADKTPATGVYIEAYTLDVDDVLRRSFVLKMVKAGRYEAALPPGVYDVFVSEASSIPRCRRVLVRAGHGQLWNLMLEHDDVYLQR